MYKIIDNKDSCSKNLSHLVAQCYYEQATGIIIDSDSLLFYLKNTDKKEILDSFYIFFDLILKIKIEIIFLYIKFPFDYKKGLGYRWLCKRILEKLDDKYTSIFKVDSIYDENLSDTSILLSSKKSMLADTAALFVAAHIHEHGFFEIKESLSIDGKDTIIHQSRCTFKIVYKMNALDSYNGKSIAQIRLQWGTSLADSIPNNIKDQIDYVCPVPNTGLYYAMGLAESLKKPYIQALFKRNSEERSFQLENADERKLFLWTKLYPLKDMIQGKCLAIVDEAIFTGATLKIVCEMLWECGVKRIYLCIPTPKCRYHCDYLVHPQRSMLLEYISENMLIDYFNCDGIYFQSDEIFKALMDEIGMNMCAECFFGKEVTYEST